MKQKNLVLFAGIPGSGKSFWAHQHLGENDAYVSRDEIRFSLVNEDENYFSRETEVFDKFVAKIEENLACGKRVFADATHINRASRRKLLERIHDKDNIDIDVYVFKTSLGTCLERNAQREGRARVPESAIYRMSEQLTDPTNEPYKYREIKYIFEDGKEISVWQPHG